MSDTLTHAYLVAQGQRIKAAREAAGLTQRKLAEHLGVTVNTISNYERGDREPSSSMVARIQRATGARGLVDDAMMVDNPPRLTIMSPSFPLPLAA